MKVATIRKLEDLSIEVNAFLAALPQGPAGDRTPYSQFRKLAFCVQDLVDLMCEDQEIPA